MGKAVEGVYTADPKHRSLGARCSPTSRTARCLSAVSRWRMRPRISLCMDNKLPIIVFNLLTEGNIARAVRGEPIGTLVSSVA